MGLQGVEVRENKKKERQRGEVGGLSLCFYVAVKESQMWIITLFVYFEDGVSSSFGDFWVDCFSYGD